jgi:hypothetical protein
MQIKVYVINMLDGNSIPITPKIPDPIINKFGTYHSSTAQYISNAKQQKLEIDPSSPQVVINIL